LKHVGIQRDVGGRILRFLGNSTTSFEVLLVLLVIGAVVYGIARLGEG